MEVIIGGAYQGKLDYARERFDLKEEDIFSCREDDTEIDFSKKCIDHLENFVLACVRAEKDPEGYFMAHEEEWKDSILICEDIFSGVVPIEQEMRFWRDNAGRLFVLLSKKAEHVTRLFLGIPQVLK